MGSEPSAELRLVQELGVWFVTLTGGEVLEVAAHGYSQERDVFCFSILMEGAPAFYRDVLRIPVALVAKIRGG